MTKSRPKTENSSKVSKKSKKSKKKFKILITIKVIIWTWVLCGILILIIPPIRNYLFIKFIQNSIHPELGKLIVINEVKFNIWDASVSTKELVIRNPFPYPPDFVIRFENLKIKLVLFEEKKFLPGIRLRSEKLEVNIYKMPNYGTNLLYLLSLMKSSNNSKRSNSILRFSELSFSKGEVRFSQSIEPDSIPIQSFKVENTDIKKYADNQTHVIKLDTNKYFEVMEKIIDFIIVKNQNISNENRNKFIEELEELMKTQ